MCLRVPPYSLKPNPYFNLDFFTCLTLGGGVDLIPRCRLLVTGDRLNADTIQSLR